MIHSMTGYGAAERAEDGVSYAFEVRSVNHRYLKLAIRLPEPLQFTEAAIERVVRTRLARGSVSCTLRVRGEDGLGVRLIDRGVLQKYVDELSGVKLPPGVQAAVDLAAVALLPGVIYAPDLDDEARQHQLDFVAELAGAALSALVGMRADEGEALREALLSGCEAIRGHLGVVAERAPRVIDEYHERLRSRVSALMEAGGFELQADGLMREVAVFAERCDISEELTRLRSHLDQFVELCERVEPAGRTMEFLTQELLREANTVAAKSNDAVIARHVVEMKAFIDRLKEQVQNVE